MVRLPYSVRLAADDADGAEARRLVAGGGEDLAGEGGDRGLAAGAGDGDEMVRLARIEARRHQRQRPARLGGAEDRRRSAGRSSAAPLAASTATAPRATASPAKRAPSAALPGSAANRIAGRDRAAVGRKPADLDRRRCRWKGSVRQLRQGLQDASTLRSSGCAFHAPLASAAAGSIRHQQGLDPVVLCAARPRAAPPSGG